VRPGPDRFLLLFVALLLLVPAGAVRAEADTASAYKRCRDIVLRNPDGSIYTQTHGLFEKHAACGLARRLARRYLSDDGVRPARILGFVCSGGSDGVACRKGRKRVTWGYYFDRPTARA
jgi:hypothetical protein